MDLNSAIHAAECGGYVRDDATMRADWTVRYVKNEKLLYYFNPQGEKKHKVIFSDAQRMSIQWRTVP
jgi:hypothetical protein